MDQGQFMRHVEAKLAQHPDEPSWFIAFALGQLVDYLADISRDVDRIEQHLNEQQC